MSHSPQSTVSAESLRRMDNWIPQEILATHPNVRIWSSDKTPAQVREVIDGVSKHLHKTRYDNLADKPGTKLLRGKVWDHMETVLAEGKNLNDYAIPSPVEMVKARTKAFAEMHCLPPPSHMDQHTRDIFASQVNSRRDALVRGDLFGFEQGMGTFADSGPRR